MYISPHGCSLADAHRCLCAQHCSIVELPEYGPPKDAPAYDVASTAGRLVPVCAPCRSDIRVHRGGLADAGRGDLLVRTLTVTLPLSPSLSLSLSLAPTSACTAAD
jgi:hypothetical protein